MVGTAREAEAQVWFRPQGHGGGRQADGPVPSFGGVDEGGEAGGSVGAGS